MPLQIAAKSQQMAAHPLHSVWVAASAGSGKTKVLTDRVLNLLLEDTPPERILCLTFTKAAAAEMTARLRERLGAWAILSDEELAASLQDLQGEAPTPEKQEKARTLFGLILDVPGGLKIQTIHSFCQSLLKRFPLEAKLSPFFDVMNETKQKQLIEQTSHEVFANPELKDTLETLILRFSESTLNDLIPFILQERSSIEHLHSATIEKRLQTEDVTAESLLTEFTKAIPKEALRNEIPTFREGSPTDQERGEKLGRYLNLPEDVERLRYDEYLNLFLTQKGEKRARLITQSLSQKNPPLLELLEREAVRLEGWLAKMNALDIADISKSFLLYSQHFICTYERLKKEQNLLDYEDLILKTAALLRDPGCHWVLYKLDGGLDHILVDEAQDTSPSQWQVIRTIAEEFYANAWADQRGRTLFIVGDQKQSIYSFQGADPKVFSEMQQDLRKFAQTSGKSWRDVDLNISFRSTPEILKVVDAVFKHCPLTDHTSLEHLPFRNASPGHVEVWPLIPKENEDTLKAWEPSLEQHAFNPPQKKLAHLMAKTIKGWLHGKSPLARPVTPGDILILVRRRTPFVDALIRSLKDHEVPVAGIDRLWLLEGIAVQDLLKIAEFLLLPNDDLVLASVLKGPLFSISEEDLFALSNGRGSSSLWSVLKDDKKFEPITAILKDLLSKTDFLTPFALFSYILGPLKGRLKWQARLGPDVLDSFDEFLSLCLAFEEEKTPSLQLFLDWISEESTELKRDLDQADQVRIMTVHGSKGLQAPIVFLPDTTEPPVDLPPFVIENEALIWLPPSLQDIPFTKGLKQDLTRRQQEEYRRLLYVALTRAEEALYICGWEGKQQESWYDLVCQGIADVGEELDFEEGELEGKGWQLSSLSAHSSLAPQEKETPAFLLPSWIHESPPHETRPHVIRPSDVEGETLFEASTLGAFGTERGILIHTLLEHLPEVAVAQRERMILNFLSQKGVDMREIKDISGHVLRVLNEFPDLFDGDSQAEVGITGFFGEVVLSGQIDRLIVKEDHILIVDFKTHREAPSTLAEIPSTYIKQMAFYQNALAQIYPGKPVHCALLWTEIPRLDLLPESVLKKFSPSIDERTIDAYSESHKINRKG